MKDQKDPKTARAGDCADAEPRHACAQAKAARSGEEAEESGVRSGRARRPAGDLVAHDAIHRDGGEIVGRQHEEPPSPQEKLRLAFELSHAAEVIMRTNLQRRHPNETASEIKERLRDWYHRRPGAEHGDGAGRVRPREQA